MGFLVSTTRSKIFKEFSENERIKFFTISRSKFVPHIDTLYYSVFLQNDMAHSKNENNSIPSNILELIEFLKYSKSLFNTDDDLLHERDFWLDAENSLLFSKRSFGIYEYCIRKEGYFDIFIADYLPNDNTPRIVVQLRSIGLWTVGEYELILESYNYLNKILKMFDINILKCQENRIDFCYHTNSIQNPDKLYNDDCLSNNLHTSFSIYNKVGRKHGKKLTVEYLSLGQRSSNNLFFRSYNKTREVIEENYKEFFLNYWLVEGLISYYDFYVYSFAYKHKNYSYIYWGMLEFYIQNGKDRDLLNQCVYIKEHSKDYTIEELKYFILPICPSPTLVLNIEFQCMRKFFYSFDKILNEISLPIEHECFEQPLLKIFQILDNRKLFLDYLTKNVVSFEKDISTTERDSLLKNNDDSLYLDFWKRLRRCKVSINYKGDIYRSYSRSINKELLISRIKGALASLSLYDENWTTDINDDMSYLINILNDNDVETDKDGVCTVIDKDYIRIKEKKKKALKSIIEQSRPSLNKLEII